MRYGAKIYDSVLQRDLNSEIAEWELLGKFRWDLIAHERVLLLDTQVFDGAFFCGTRRPALRTSVIESVQALSSSRRVGVLSGANHFQGIVASWLGAGSHDGASRDGFSFSVIDDISARSEISRELASRSLNSDAELFDLLHAHGQSQVVARLDEAWRELSSSGAFELESVSLDCLVDGMTGQVGRAQHLLDVMPITSGMAKYVRAKAVDALGLWTRHRDYRRLRSQVDRVVSKALSEEGEKLARGQIQQVWDCIEAVIDQYKTQAYGSVGVVFAPHRSSGSPDQDSLADRHGLDQIVRPRALDVPADFYVRLGQLHSSELKRLEEATGEHRAAWLGEQDEASLLRMSEGAAKVVDDLRGGETSFSDMVLVSTRESGPLACCIAATLLDPSSLLAGAAWTWFGFRVARPLREIRTSREAGLLAAGTLSNTQAD